MLLTISALIVALIASAYLYIKYSFSYWQRKGVPSTKPRFPFGSLTKTFTQKLSFADDVQNIYHNTTAPFVGIYSFLQPILLIRDPELIRRILIKDFAHFSHFGWQLNENVDPMSKNILMQKGEKWRNTRTKLSPAFSSGKLKEMFETIVECGDSLEKYVSEFVENGKNIEITDVLSCFTTNVIASVGFGIDIDTIMKKSGPDGEFRKNGCRFFETTFKNTFRKAITFSAPKLARFLGLRFVDKDVGDFMIDVVRQNVDYREKNNIVRKDFFQLLMQLRNSGAVQQDGKWASGKSGELMPFDEMAAHAFLFFVGGYESSSTAMSFCMYELAKNQKIQQKLYDEIVAVLEKHNECLSYESVGEMKYLECCINETLRKHSPFGFLVRCCTKDYEIPDTNVIIDEGTTVAISVSGLQNDPKYYEQPDKFIPERFDEENVSGKSFTEMPFLTFGDGPRICMGLRLAKLESKIAILLLLRRFKFELADQHRNVELEIDPKSAAKAAKYGIHLKVSAR